MADQVAQNEAEAYKKVAEREGITKFGGFHGERSRKLGKRLGKWYWLVGSFFALTVAAYFLHACFFAKIAAKLSKAIVILGGSSLQLNADQILLLYFTSKASLIAIFLIPLIWALKRITHMQALRSVHADKEALANTLEAILNSGIEEIKSPASVFAMREIFSSSYNTAKTKSKEQGDALTISDIKGLVPTLKELLTEKAEK